MSTTKRQTIINLRNAALEKQKGRCIYCKAPLTKEAATADHLHPRDRGGRTIAGNIVAACHDCNQVKGTMGEDRFFKLISDKKRPPKRSDILLIWATRRIWKRTHKACYRIGRFAGCEVRA